MESRDPEWAYLAPGIRWLMRPLTVEIATAVSVRVAAMVAAAMGGDLKDFFDLGFTIVDLPAGGVSAFFADPAHVAGLSAYAAATWYADALVVDWEGPTNSETREPAPLTPENIRRAMRVARTAGAGPMILQPLLAWLWEPKELIAPDLPILDLIGRARAFDEPADRERLLRTSSARAALKACQDPRAWARSGAAGPLVGLEYASCLDMVPDARDSDGAALVRCLRAIEAGALASEVRH